MKNKPICAICLSELDFDAGDFKGTFGISEVGFCVWCYSSIIDMVIQTCNFNDIETLEERINEIKEENETEKENE